MKQIFETNAPQETRALGVRLGQAAEPGQVYCLDGDLGVGKTVFSQGFAEGLGIHGPVNSPTFTIIQTYETGRLPFYHMDVYRLEEEEEMEAIGGEELLYGRGVCLVEWGSIIAGLLPEDCFFLRIEKDLEKGTDFRKITLERKGDRL